MKRKLVKTETQTFIKGKTYNMADGDLNLPKLEYGNYFEMTDDEIEGEWMAMDRCKKSFTVVTKIYE